MPATLTTDEKRRTRFGAALSEALHVNELTQAEFADLLGTRQHTISAWTTGTALPADVESVFRLEQVLGLRPGHLSRHLGFRPATKLAVLDAMADDDQIDGSAKRLLTATYKDLVAQAKRRHPTAHKVSAVKAKRRVA